VHSQHHSGGHGIKLVKVKPNSLIVFEGLDKAGKSTQLERLRGLPWAEPAPYCAHMPSGLTRLTSEIYALLENVKPKSQLARQLLHLACHAENTPAIIRQRQETAVILDRFWWSTVAYGWHGAQIGSSGLEWTAFMNLIDSIWQDLTPDLVFLFINPFEDDSNNKDAVEQGYRKLNEEFSGITVVVPRLSVEDTSDFILEVLTARGFIG
jgi:dTMP kinase